MKLNTLKKWFRTLLALSISFVMVIGIFGGMKLEAKAANNIIIDVGDPNSMENFKSIIFNSDDTLTIHDSRGIISNGNCYSPDGYDGSIFNTITFDTKGYGSLYFTDLKGGIGNPQINNPQWQVSNIVYGYNTAHTIRIDFKLVDADSKITAFIEKWNKTRKRINLMVESNDRMYFLKGCSVKKFESSKKAFTVFYNTYKEA